MKQPKQARVPLAPRSSQRGSTLIVLLVAALIVAILWVTRFGGKEEKKAEEPIVATQSVESMQKSVDRVREVQQLEAKRVEDLNRKMVDLDRH